MPPLHPGQALDFNGSIHLNEYNGWMQYKYFIHNFKFINNRIILYY